MLNMFPKMLGGGSVCLRVSHHKNIQCRFVSPLGPGQSLGFSFVKILLPFIISKSSCQQVLHPLSPQLVPVEVNLKE